MDELTTGEKKLPWYFKNSVVVVAFLSVGPLALPLVWFHPKMSRTQKILWTVVTLVLTYFLTIVTLNAFKKIMGAYQQFQALG